MNIRVGHGYDAHRLVEERQLVLGGVCIPYKKGLLGHSDADVLTHAVMDALLGALALGTIGDMFPDNDPKYEGICSLFLLKQVCRRIHTAGWKIGNIDATVIAQAPRLAPYIRQISMRLAYVCGVPKDCVSVKATTEEHMGFTGSGEGMAAHAVCLLRRSNRRPARRQRRNVKCRTQKE